MGNPWCRGRLFCYSEYMGFYDFMKRVVEGQPVFQEGDETSRKPAADQDHQQPREEGVHESASTIVKHKEDTFPFVEVTHLKSHTDGTTLQLYGHIKNEWHDEVLLDKIVIFGMKRELDTFLRGHEERDFLLYKGPVLRHDEHEAHIDYKTRQEGDYFRANFRVKCVYNSNDQTYTVSELHLHRPVLDIYE